MELEMSEQQENFLQPLLDLMNKRMDTIESKVDSNTTLTNQVLDQARRTNGRVTKLEKIGADKKNNKTASRFNLNPSIIYLIAIGAVIVLVIVATLIGAPIKGIL